MNNKTNRKPAGCINRQAGFLKNIMLKSTNAMLKVYFFYQNHKHKILGIFTFFSFLMIVMFPGQVLATKLEDQLDKVNSLMTDKIKKYGISGAVITGGIWSLFKGNIKLAGVIVMIGIILGFYLKWIEGGMQIG